MPDHIFGLPAEKKYSLDTEKHVHAAASYGAVEHNAGRLSDEKFSELSANIEKAKKRLGLGDEKKDGGEDRSDAAERHVVVHQTSEGPNVTVHASKKEATEHAKDLRSNGASAYIFSEKDYKSTQDPKWNPADHVPAGPHNESQVYKAEKATKAAKDATAAAKAGGGVAAHARAGEAHLEAAKAHMEAAKGSPYAAQHEAVAALHREAAEVHASAAGAGWDEGKHPRDENGKFSSDSRDSRWQVVQRFDFASGELTSQKRTQIGGLVARANLTRTGVLEYRAGDGSIRRELRHPDDVFDADSLASLAHATVTDDHPGRVTTDNWRAETIGHIAGTPQRAADTTASGDQLVQGQIHIQHGPAIDKADAGKLKEASCGYSCSYDPTPGEYRGQRYDGRQRNIRYNHLALGPPGWGRAGPDVSLRMDAKDLSYAVSGLPISEPASFAREQHHEDKMTDAEKQAELEKAQAAAKKAALDLEQARADATKATTEIDKLKAQISTDQATLAQFKAENDILKLQASRPTEDSLKMAQMKKDEEAQIDLMIGLRADARGILGDDWKHAGKDAHRIRCEVLARLEPDFKVDGRATVALDIAAVEVAYPLAVRNDAKVREATDQLKKALAPAQRLDEMSGGDEVDVEGARKKMDQRKRDAWKMTPKRKDRARMRMVDSAVSPSTPKF